jgi:hypothetical protein
LAGSFETAMAPRCVFSVFLRDGDGAAMRIQRVVVLVEQDRQRRHGLAGLGGMLAIVQADADDLLRVRHARAKLRFAFRDEKAVGRSAGASLRLEPAQPADIAAPEEHIGDGGRRILVEFLFGRHDVENAAIGPEAEAVAVVVA